MHNGDKFTNDVGRTVSYNEYSIQMCYAEQKISLLKNLDLQLSKKMRQSTKPIFDRVPCMKLCWYIILRNSNCYFQRYRGPGRVVDGVRSN